MGIIRDILDAAKDISSLKNIEGAFKSKRYSSISKRSLEGTLQFPTLVSKSMDIDTLQDVSKALERQFTTFVQITLTMNPFLNLGKEGDAIGYLRKFHQNTNVKTDYKDLMNFGADMLESYTGYANELKNVFMFAEVYEGATLKVKTDNKEQLIGILESLRPDILNDKFVPRNVTFKFANENLSAHYNSTAVREARGDQPFQGTGPFREGESSTLSGQDIQTNIQMRQLSSQQANADRQFEFQKQQADRQQADSDRRHALELDKARPKMKDLDFTRVPTDILKDNDVKKANELVPTTLHIKTIIVDEENQQQGTMDFIIGVKATMHPIASDEMVANMVRGCKSQNKFFDFVRWTSGEISFFKDFVFGIGEIKDDVLDRSSGSTPWWITLKRRRALAKLKNGLMMGHGILPNTSIVLSMEEVEYIKSEFGFDLMNDSFAAKIMNQYFLLSFVVVDNSSQIAHFLFDGQTSYQSVTFSGMQKENSSKTDIKEVLKIINRANLS